jgi:hypothetical protein
MELNKAITKVDMEMDGKGRCLFIVIFEVNTIIM